MLLNKRKTINSKIPLRRIIQCIIQCNHFYHDSYYLAATKKNKEKKINNKNI